MSRTINTNQLDAIIFDLGGVILNLDYNLTINAFKKLGGKNFDQLYTQAHQDKIFDQYETGQLSSEDFIAYLMQFLPDVHDPDKIISAWNAMLLDLPATRVELLKQLGKTHQLFLFSNTNEIHFKAFSEHIQNRYSDKNLLDNLFITAYYSHKIGRRKPNADAFQLVINEHHLDPSKTLFIDDSIQHIEGAGKVGLNTYHLVNEDIIDIFETP